MARGGITIWERSIRNEFVIPDSGDPAEKCFETVHLERNFDNGVEDYKSTV